MFLVSLLSTIAIQHAGATGCDCSCFGYRETVKEQSGYGSDFGSQTFILKRDGNSLKVADGPTNKGWLKREVEFKGLADGNPVKPKLLDRIFTELPHFVIYRRDIELEVYESQCTDDAKALTGQYTIYFKFDTGESVTLKFPVQDDLVDRESGEIRHENLLPLNWEAKP